MEKKRMIIKQSRKVVIIFDVEAETFSEACELIRENGDTGDGKVVERSITNDYPCEFELKKEYTCDLD